MSLPCCSRESKVGLFTGREYDELDWLAWELHAAPELDAGPVASKNDAESEAVDSDI